MATISNALPVLSETAAPDPHPVPAWLVCGALRLFDVVAICGASAVAHWFWLAGADALALSSYMLVAFSAALLTVNFLQFAGVYKWEKMPSIGSTLGRTLGVWAAVIAVLVLAAFVTKTSDQFSRAWLLLWFGLAAVLLGTARVVAFLAILDWKYQGRLQRNVVVFGMGPIGERLISRLVSHPGRDIRVVGFFDDRVSRTPEYCWQVPMLGDLDALIDYVRHHPVDSVVITLPATAEERLVDILEKLSVAPVDVQLCSGTLTTGLRPLKLNDVGGVPVLDVVASPLPGWQHAVKTAEDFVIGSLILALIAPLMAIIAVAVKLDSPGPVFFRQKRYGYNNQLIEIYKFRTMYAEMSDADAEQLTLRNDPRVTRLGGFLRKTSLDELPQFLNVLKGEMSIVGPRPHAMKAKAGTILYEDAVDRYAARHRVKPGITGWAQINGWRGETSTVEQIEQRVRHDLSYIENWSLGLDLKIIVWTAFAGFTNEQAF